MQIIRQILLLTLLLSTPLSAQRKRLITLVDLIEVPRLSSPRLAPDGSQILYVQREADWEENKTISHVWRVNADGTNSIQLTNGENGEGSPRWSPDATRISFVARRGKADKNQIFLISNGGGEGIQLSDHATGLSSTTWTPDGAYIYFIATDEKPEGEEKGAKAGDDVFAFEEHFQQRHLWRINVSTQEEKRITEGDFTVLSYRFSRDGKQIVYHRAPSPVLASRHLSEIWTMNNEGKRQKQLTDNSIGEGGAKFSPDNRQILFTSGTNDKWEPYYNSNLFVQSTRSGDARILMADSPWQIFSATWANDNSSIYVLANTGVRTELFKLAVSTGKLDQLTSGDHAISSWSYFAKTDQHVFTKNEATNGGDVWLLSGGASVTTKRITHVFDYLSAEFNLGRQEAIRWKGADGVQVEGIINYPPNYRKGRKYPLIVRTHGGPRSSDKFGFITRVHAFTAKGYVVLRPNYRGSTGYGDDFLRDMVGGYFRQSHLDVMAGADHLIELGIADGNKMVKMGWSAGGHMTNKIITFTDRFKAASSGAGAVNWISMYGQSDVHWNRTPWFGGTPWEENAPIDVYWENSPLKDIWKVKTPTLILVGENDERVPPPQSLELYRALVENGVDTDLYIAPGEPHGWRQLRHILFRWNVQLEWFEKYARGRKYEWEQAPEKEKSDEEEK